MKTTHVALRLAALGLSAGSFALPAAAQESSYTGGTIWQFSQIKVEPGQFENYVDYLGGNWRRELELEKKEGYVVSYHVLSVNNPRAGEPDLILATEYKDYLPTAQQEALQKKVMAAMASDPHKMEAQSGERVKMRTLMGGMELQELKLK